MKIAFTGLFVWIAIYVFDEARSFEGRSRYFGYFMAAMLTVIAVLWFLVVDDLLAQEVADRSKS